MLSDAKFNLRNDRSLRTVEDRAFYAMYHAVLEILEVLDFAPRSQSGAIALLGKEVVKEREIVDPEFHSMISKYQARRQEADYEKEFLRDRADAEEFVQDDERLVSEMKQVLTDLEEQN